MQNTEATVENPIAAAPVTPPRWPGWIASVSAGIAVIVLTTLWVWAGARIFHCVDRETCEQTTARAVDAHRTETSREITQHERRITEAEKQGRESHSVLVELRTKTDMILQRLSHK